MPKLNLSKAELLKKGVIDGGSNAAKEAYQKGVQAAIEQWGQKMPDHYFENPEAAYDDTLERIHEPEVCRTCSSAIISSGLNITVPVFLCYLWGPASQMLITKCRNALNIHLLCSVLI